MLCKLARPSYDIHIPSAQKTSTSGTEASARKGGGVCVCVPFIFGLLKSKIMGTK